MCSSMSASSMRLSKRRSGSPSTWRPSETCGIWRTVALDGHASLSLRGQAAQAAELLDWIETTSREIGSAEMSASGVGAAAVARAALGQHQAARALLSEIERSPEIRANAVYFNVLPAMMRTSLHLGETALAERLLSGLESHYPLAEHALDRDRSRPRGGPRRPASCGRCLCRRRRSLGAVWDRSRAGVRASWQRAMSPRPRATERGCTRPAARTRDLRPTSGGSRLGEIDALLQQAITLSS